jgi:hypothetical protein
MFTSLPYLFHRSIVTVITPFAATTLVVVSSSFLVVPQSRYWFIKAFLAPRFSCHNSDAFLHLLRKMALKKSHRAPGGYSAAILKLHKTAKVFGITLPKDQGGVRFPKPIRLFFHWSSIAADSLRNISQLVFLLDV